MFGVERAIVRKLSSAEVAEARNRKPVAEGRGAVAAAVDATVEDLYEAKLFHVDKLNQNNRVYTRANMQANIDSGQFCGSVDHGTGLATQCVMYHDLRIEADGSGMGTFSILPTDGPGGGKNLKIQCDSGMPVGFSTYGFGGAHKPSDAERKKYGMPPASDDDTDMEGNWVGPVVMDQDGPRSYALTKIDAVDDPSVPDARLQTQSRGEGVGDAQIQVVSEACSNGLHWAEVGSCGHILSECKCEAAESEIKHTVYTDRKCSRCGGEGESLTVAQFKTAMSEAKGGRTPVSEGREPLVKSLTQYMKGRNSFEPVGPMQLAPELSKDAFNIIPTYDGVRFVRHVTTSDELYHFQGSVTEGVLKEIDNFWGLKEDYAKYGVMFHRGVLMHGPPGCHAAGTDIVMIDGSLRKVEDVKLGDEVMGPDSQPREVLRLVRGRETMYRVTPRQGEPFVVNGSHILSLKHSGERDCNYPSVLNITVTEYLGLAQPTQQRLKLWRAGVKLAPKEGRLPVDPYILGVWLGDGSTSKPEVTTADEEIAVSLAAEASGRGLRLVNRSIKGNKASSYHIVGTGAKGSNTLTNDLRSLGIYDDKAIPESYLVADEKARLELLAGIVDTDGAFNAIAERPTSKKFKTGRVGIYEVTQVRAHLALQVVRLARSLGLRATCVPCTKTIKSTGFSGTYSRIQISGDVWRIPVRLPRKKAIQGEPNKDPLRTGIVSIQSVGEGDYYGFTLSGDHLYLTGDFVVHHNCGKSSAINQTVDMITGRGDVVFYGRNIGVLIEGLNAFRQVEPDRKVVVVLEDADEYVGYQERDMLNLLDGANTIENVLYLATTNYLSRFPERLLRPGRFDKKIFVGPPPMEGRKAYFEHKLGKVESPEEIDRLARETDGLSFGHLRELITAVYALKEPKADVLKRLKPSRLAQSADSTANSPAKLAAENTAALPRRLAIQSAAQAASPEPRSDSMTLEEALSQLETGKAELARVKGENTALVAAINPVLVGLKEVAGVNLPQREVLPTETAERITRLAADLQAEKAGRVADKTALDAQLVTLNGELATFKAKEATALRLTKVVEKAAPLIKDNAYAKALSLSLKAAALDASFDESKVEAFIAGKVAEYDLVSGKKPGKAPESAKPAAGFNPNATTLGDDDLADMEAQIIQPEAREEGPIEEAFQFNF